MSIHRYLKSSIPLLTILFCFSCISTFIFWQKRQHDLADLTWSQHQYGLGSDPSRFLLQAFWLSKGFGYREVSHDGPLCTSLPSGNPVVLATILYFVNDLGPLRLIQSTFPFLSGAMIYFSLRKTPFLAWIASFLIAASPWQNALASCHMSEPTSTLFVSLSILTITILLSRFSQSEPENLTLQGRIFNSKNILGLAGGTLFGFSCFAAIMTSPGLIFTMLVIFASGLLKLSHLRLILISILFGFCVPLTMWQIHCTVATGSPVATLLTPLNQRTQDEKAWIRTWARNPDEASRAFNAFDWNINGDFSKVPNHAFRDENEKKRIIVAYNSYLNAISEGRNADKEDEERIKILADITADRITNEKVNYYLTLPIQRGVASWIQQQPVNHLGHDSMATSSRLLPWNLARDLEQYGVQRTLLRALRGTIGIYSVCIHALTLVTMGYCIYLGLRNYRYTLPLLLSVVLYSYLHGLSTPEPRRNLPFVPIILAIPCLLCTLPIWLPAFGKINKTAAITND